jgi:hypothetical protein
MDYKTEVFLDMIFGIGLSKTGTSSLAKALKVLGYKVKHYPLESTQWTGPKAAKVVLPVLNTINRLFGKETFSYRETLYRNYNNHFNLSFFENYEAACDLPLALYYKELYEHYPDAKFILTTRDLDSWLNSAEKHFTVGIRSIFQHHRNRVRLDIYDSIEFDRQKFLNAYTQHTINVRNFFAGKDNYLELDVCEGDGYDKLSPFLGKEIISENFPRENFAYN